MKNHYRLLGVSPSATLDELKAAFRRVARRVHPDINDSPDAAERFKAVKKAYDELRHVHRHRRTVPRSAEAATQGRASEPRPVYVRHAQTHYRADFLNRLADRMAGLLGRDIEPDLEVRLSRREAFFGGRFELEVPVQTSCPRCGGRMAVWGVRCPACRGRGSFVSYRRYALNVPGRFHGREVLFARPCSMSLGDPSLVVLVTDGEPS